MERDQFIRLLTALLIIMLVPFSPLLLIFIILSKIWECIICKPTKSIANEVAVVTGAAGGLGRAIALELAKRGCHIAVVDVNIEGAEETVRQIHEISKVKAKAYRVNVTSFAEITDLKTNVEQDLGSVTILINNAGILLHSKPLDPAPEDVQRMIDVNLTSHFWTKFAFLPTMKKLRKGNIVTISSVGGILPLAFNTAYTASKFGSTGHMKALRMELALEKQHNIHVTTVMPSFLDTNDEISQMVHAIKANRVYPLIKGKSAANRIVRGMLAEEREIKLPYFVDTLHRILNLLPIKWQEGLILITTSKLFLKFKKNFV
ncbi:epidermal retinol dehydrogenase 2-like isoform X2 [Drosophila sulfurigaster albostrigata]|uniref:epidermal retinol dehydrogenase 2-like isoform X2 n=1 Tax=Drosophila sulfurigaster albostrigata TaxID=89887 RepID=UPI002D21AD74|nr:epidermal retinol dehydrogenase 2-like isoform X2 [Drosophila sulfurigaster albostrigata]